MSGRPRTGARVAAGVGGVAAGAVFGLLVPFPASFGDMFHLGEFYVAATTVAQGSPAGTPFTVHGALDVVPGLAVRAVVGADRVLVPTIVVYLLLALLAMVLFVVLVARLLPPRPALLPFMALAGFAAAWTVHYRDLLLVAALLSVTLAVQAETPRARAWWAGGTGVVVTLGVLWSWNRGLIGAVAVLGACLLIGLADRSRRSMLLALVAVPAAALVLSAVPLFRPDVVLENLAVVIEGNSLAKLPWESVFVRIAWFMAVPVAGAALALLVYLWQGRRSALVWGQAWLWAVVLAGMAKVALDRIDPIHLVMALWAPVAIGALAGPAVAERVPRPLRLSLAGAALIAMVLLSDGDRFRWAITALAAALLLSPWLTRPWRARSAVAVVALGATAVLAWQVTAYRASAWGWLGDAARSSSTADLVPEGVTWAAEQLRGQPCILDASSQGMINALADLPTCTRYGYLPWVPASQQPDLRAQVEAQPPDVIVWTRNGGQITIGALPLGDQLRDFMTWLDEEYPVEVCRADTCLRIRG